MISLRLDQEEENLIRQYAKLNHKTLTDLIKNAVIEKIENEIDLTSFNKAMKEMEKTYSFEDVKKELGL